MKARLVLLLGAALLALPSALHAQLVFDDFNDGNDDGWLRLIPLSEMGLGGTADYTFPGGNTYRIQSPVSPNPAAAGPARAGALWADVTYTTFRISIDFVDWDSNLQQDLGIIMRGTNPGLGTLDGYVVTYDVDEAGNLYLSRIVGESAAEGDGGLVIASIPVFFDPTHDYRVVVHGFGEDFLVEAYDLADLSTPVASFTGSDSTFPSGAGGFFNNSGDDFGTTDSTFDNYSSSPDSDIDSDGIPDPLEVALFGNLVEDGDGDFDNDGQTNAEELLAGTLPNDPSSLFEILDIDFGAKQTAVTFPIAADRAYNLQCSTDLNAWANAKGVSFNDNGDGTGTLTLPGNGGTRKYFRVQVSLD